MAAGLAFDLEGPDAQSVAIPPAPTLASAELAAEMAEVYVMALARDIPFAFYNDPVNVPFFNDVLMALNGLEWFNSPADPTDPEAERRRRRGLVTMDNLFRGILPGSLDGPFLSQFLIIGSQQLGAANASAQFDGIFAYGSITVNQRVRIADMGKDFLTDFDTFLDAQDAADFRGIETYQPGKRLIQSVRDLATWVHFDALYEAYLNACLIMLANGVPFDPSIPFTQEDVIDAQTGFTTFGPAHILSLVTEVATRALKAVWYQKFNVHRRLRPEAAGGLIHIHKTAGIFPEVASLVSDLEPILAKVAVLNRTNNMNAGDPDPDTSYLLPMAFAEGSPMHPSYGAGHATVAGACVTILKAFFKADAVFDKVFEVDPVADTLVEVTIPGSLTVGNELNKLADNISIGRNMAGVHYFTDGFESLLLGEQIAIGILEEQKLTFGETFFLQPQQV